VPWPRDVCPPDKRCCASDCSFPTLSPSNSQLGPGVPSCSSATLVYCPCCASVRHTNGLPVDTDQRLNHFPDPDGESTTTTRNEKHLRQAHTAPMAQRLGGAFSKYRNFNKCPARIHSSQRLVSHPAGAQVASQSSRGC
jgi:YD repeat-containing protein